MIRVKTFSEQIVEFIKSNLLEGSLKPGDPVRETEIASRLGLSRGPVREALQMLREEGLISSEPRKQHFITSLSPEEIADRYALGGILEAACIVHYLHLFTKEHFEDLNAILGVMESAAGHASCLSSLSGVDEQFHFALLAPCQNRYMAACARATCSHISKFLYYNAWNTLYTPHEFVKRHKIILDVLSTRDKNSIETTLLEHYAETGRRLGKKI